MTQKILVTYASRSGSTSGVAEEIGKTLRKNGTVVDVLSMQAVKDLTPYDAVVAGSAIQAHQWLPEALQFVRENKLELRRKPFAAFLVCMTLAMRNGETYRLHVAEAFVPVRAQVQTVSEGVFAGALELGKIPSIGDRLKFGISVLLGVWPAGDSRNWPAIRAWAEGLQLK